MTPEWERAATEGDAAALAALIEAGANVDALDRYGQTGLMLAARVGHLEVVERLIRAGANLDVTAKYGLSATMLAVVNHKQDVALALAAAGADLNLAGTGYSGFYGMTAADLARQAGFEALSRELTPTGTDT